MLATTSRSSDTDPRSMVGQWDLDRRVTDRLAGVTGRMLGTLTVSPVRWDREGDLLWGEEGTLDWGGCRLHARRSLALSIVDGEWWMTFDHGGLFHPWRPDERLEHPCGPDRYLGWVRLDAERRQMRTLWDVAGPSKRQRIFTRFCKRDASAPGTSRTGSGRAR